MDHNIGEELWRFKLFTGNTVNTTGPVERFDILPGSLGSSPLDLRVVDGNLYFTAETGLDGRQLFRIGPTDDAPTRVTDQNGNGISPQSLYAAPGGLYYFSNNRLTRFDGTRATVITDDLGSGRVEATDFHLPTDNRILSAGESVAWVVKKNPTGSPKYLIQKYEPQNFGYVFSGAALDAGLLPKFSGTEFVDVGQALDQLAPSDFGLKSASEIFTSVIGDVNGDGRDDIAASDAVSLGISSGVQFAESQDIVRQFGVGGLNSATVSASLNTTGIGSTNTAAEVALSTYLVTGTPGTNVSLPFKLEIESGDFQFTFGAYDIAAITADPITQRQEFARQAIQQSVTAGWVVFSEHDAPAATDGDSKSISVPAGTELGFFIIPNNSASTFLADPSQFYNGTANPNFIDTSRKYSPLFSVANANPGQKDQMLSFIGNGKTLMMFDDVPRSLTAGDQDFDDLVFSINAPLSVVDRLQPQALGDVNGDGRDDVAIRNGGRLQVVFGNSSAAAINFAAPNVTISGFSGNELTATAGDFNGDGQSDLAVLDAEDGQVSIFLSIATGGATRTRATADAVLTGQSQSSVTTGFERSVTTSKTSANSSALSTTVRGRREIASSDIDNADISFEIEVSGTAGSTLTVLGKLTDLTTLILPTTVLPASADLAIDEGSTLNVGASLASLDFDGTNDFVDLGSVSTLNNQTNNFTLTAWIKPDTLTGVDRILSSSNGTAWGFGTIGTGLRFTTYSKADYDKTLTTPLVAGQWAYVAVTFSSSNVVEFFVNGVSVGAETTRTGPTGAANTGTGSFRIGSTGASEFFDGRLNDVGVWAGVLNTTQLDAARRGDLASIGLNPIGFWRLNEGSGTTIASAGPTTISGTLTNGPTWGSDVTSSTAGVLSISTLGITAVENGLTTVTVHGGSFPLVVRNLAPTITQTPNLGLAHAGAGLLEGDTLTFVPNATPGRFDVNVNGATVDQIIVADPGTTDLATLDAIVQIENPDGTVSDFSQRALTFSNTSSVELPNTVLNGLTNLTTTFWFKTANTGQQFVVSAANSTTADEFVVQLANATTLAVLVHGEPVSWTGLPSLADNAFHHVAVVRNTAIKQVELFLDGVSRGTRTLMGPQRALNVAVGGLFLGQDQDLVGGGFNPAQAFVGTLSNVTMWSRALTASEVGSVHQNLVESRLLRLIGGDLRLRLLLNDGVGTEVRSSDLRRITGRVTNPDWTGFAPALFDGSVQVRDEGNYTLRIRMSDRDGGVVETQRAFIVANAAPTVSPLNFKPAAAIGTALQFVGGVTDAGPDDRVTRLWEVTTNNGQTIAPSDASFLRFTPEFAGTYTVTLTAGDNDGAVSSNSQTITVNPIARIAGAPASSVVAGSGIALSGATSSAIADAGLFLNSTPVVREYLWTASNGAVLVGANTINPTLVPINAGATTVTLKVSDVIGANRYEHTVTSSSFTATTAAAATITADAANANFEGNTLTFSASGLPALPTDTAGNPIATRLLAWTAKDNANTTIATGSASDFRFVAPDGGNHTITLTVTDDFGGGRTLVRNPTPASLVVAVENVAPDLDTIAGLAIAADGSVTLNGRFTDAGLSDTFTATISWGDGQTTGPIAVTASLLATGGQVGTFSFNHAYSGNGNFSITVTINDDVGSDSRNLTARDVIPATADIVDVTPDPRNTAAGIVTINFTENVTGVDVSDFTLTRSSGGPPEPIDLAGLTVTQVGPRQYTLDLSTRTAATGSYTLRLNAISAGILDVSGNALLLDATDTWTTDADTPTATISGIDPTIRNTAVGVVTIDFNEPVTGLSIDDFTLTRSGDGVSLLGLTVTPVSTSRYTLDLSSVTGAAGEYALTLNSAGSNIRDAVTNELAANVVATWTNDLTAPTADVVNISPDPRNSAVGEVTIQFSEDVTGVDLGDFTLTRDGTPVGIGFVPFTQVSDAEYTLDLTDVTNVSGTYRLTLNASGSGIQDLAGNAITADGTDVWFTDSDPATATIVDVSPRIRNTPVGLVTINFTEDVTGLDVNDFALTRDGLTLDLTDAVLTEITPRQFTLDLSALEQFDGRYELTLNLGGSGVQDPFGNESADSVSDDWFVDTAAPDAVISDVVIGPFDPNAGVLTITFNEPVSGVDAADFTLTRSSGGSPETLPLASLTVTELNSMEYALDLSSLTATDGEYVLTLNAATSGITDRAGNALVTGASEPWLKEFVEVIADAAGPYSLDAGRDLELGGSISHTHPDQTFEWDFDSDGSADFVSSSAESVAPWLSIADAGLGAGTHTITLRVLLNDNVIDTDTASLTIGGTFFFDMLSNDDLVLKQAGTDVELRDRANNTLVSRVKVAGLSAIQVLGSAFDNTLTVDLSGGQFVPTNGLSFDGGGFSSGIRGDVLRISGATTGSVEHQLVNDGSGAVLFSGRSISYAAVTSVVDELTAAARVITFGDDDDALTLGNDAQAANNVSRVTNISSGVAVEFQSPTASLTINAGDGNDAFALSAIDALFAASLTFNGGNGDDGVTSGAYFGKSVTLLGGAGSDTLIAGAGNDSVNGGIDDDLIDGGLGNDAISGGDGTDLLRASGNVNFTLTDNALTGQGTDSLFAIESAQLNGGDAANTLDVSGFTGQATINGGAGADQLVVTRFDSAFVFGGTGQDTLRVGGATLDLTILGNERLVGIDRVSLFGNGPQTLNLNLLEVLNLFGETNSLIVDRDAEDTVNIGGGWIANGRDTIGGKTFEVFQQDTTKLFLEFHNRAPTITVIANQSTNEDVAITNLPFIVGDVETATSNLQITVMSDNTAVVPHPTLGGSGANRTLTISPASNQFGSATITVTVADEDGASTSRQFTVTVNSVNDAPTISAIADQNFVAGTPINFTIGDAETAANSLTVSATSATQTIVANSGLNLTGTGTDRSLQITPVAGAFGSTQITISISDGAITTTRQFVLTVLADLTFNIRSSSAITATTTINTTLSVDASNRLVVKYGTLTDTQLIAANLIRSITINGTIGKDNVNLSPLTAAKFTRLTRVTVNGNDNNDTVTGSVFADSLVGGAGNDSFVGGDGADTLVGGDGNDFLDGGLGNDSVVGGAGLDTLLGGAGTNTLDGGTDDDLLRDTGDVNFTLTNSSLTGTGTNAISNIELATLSAGTGTIKNVMDASAFSGKVTLLGLAGDDSLIGGSNNDSLDGGAGNDTLTGGLGNDTFNGGAGIDLVCELGVSSAIASTTTINSSAGLDSLVAASVESLKLIGTSGADTFAMALTGGYAGKVNFDGREGNDTLSAGAGAATLTGGDGDDQLKGGGAADKLFGGAGNDSLDGMGGNDTLQGGVGDDTLNGNSGTDCVDEVANGKVTIRANSAPKQVASDNIGADQWLTMEQLKLTGGGGDEFFDARQSSLPATLTGNDGNDTLLGGAFIDSVVGGNGDDYVSGGAGLDTIGGGAGTDTHYEQANADFTVTGSKISSSATGTTETPTSIERIVIVGGAGNNKLNASAATVPVVLIGGKGNDSLTGGSANDTLSGGNRLDSGINDGIDTLNGNAGADTYETDPQDNQIRQPADVVIDDIFTLLPDWIDQVSS